MRACKHERAPLEACALRPVLNLANAEESAAVQKRKLKLEAKARAVKHIHSFKAVGRAGLQS